ncbi:MAG TPA: ATP-binding protein [Candidatus Lokiarchaeia archaeon]|nr:ATP-binding protein [Candidatus Lokiarchaeia archaeon]
MHTPRFIDREQEIKSLQHLLESPTFELTVLFGRRRIGKTMLARHVAQSCNAIYYLAQTESNLDLFYDECAFRFPEINDVKKDYESIFKFLKDKVDLVIIDEFPNMIKENDAILSKFNSIIENNFYKQLSRLKLVLCGSSIFLMKSKVLDSSQPLYGRTTSILEIKPMPFFSLREFFPTKSFVELVEIFGFAGGAPYYLDKIEPEQSFWDWLEIEVSDPNSFFIQEMTILFEMEFTNASLYKNVTRAIATGKTRMSEIANAAKISTTTLPSYLQTLMHTGFITREMPITDKRNEAKNGRYFLNDNFMKFWFKFIYPRLSALSIGIYDIQFIRDNYSTYLGAIFEDLIKQIMIKHNGEMWHFSNIGKYWGRYNKKVTGKVQSVEIELDILAYDDASENAYIGECKWSENVNPKEILAPIMEYAMHVTFNGKPAKKVYTYLIFAKSFTEKLDTFEENHIQCFDIRDLERLCWNL